MRPAACCTTPPGRSRSTALWTESHRPLRPFRDRGARARRQILRDNLAAELNATAATLKRVASRDLVTRDFTLTALRRALVEVLVHFPVYRTYISTGGRSADDKRILDWALAGGAAHHPRRRPSGARPAGSLAGRRAAAQPRAVHCGGRGFPRRCGSSSSARRSPPKAVEDTAFYRYGRLLSRNEVGSDPGRFAVTPAAFHATAKPARSISRDAMLATATHDHKRGEDVRARLAVLTEMPEDWAAAVHRWARLQLPAPPHPGRRRGAGHDAQLMLYQTLVGAWPLGLAPDDEAGVRGLRWSGSPLGR